VEPVMIMPVKSGENCLSQVYQYMGCGLCSCSISCYIWWTTCISSYQGLVGEGVLILKCSGCKKI